MHSLTHHPEKAGWRLLHRATHTLAVVAACASLPTAQVARAQYWQQDAAFAPVLESPAHPSDQKITALARQPDGKLLVAGYVERVNGQARDNPSAPLRFNGDGTLDPSFQASDPATGLFLQPSGKIVTPEGERLLADGRRDLAFQFASDLRTVEAMDPLGRLYVRRADGTLVRTTIDGVDDGQFRTGIIPYSASAFTPLADGSVVVAFLDAAQPNPSTLSIAWLRADGTEDPGFKRIAVPAAIFLGMYALPHDQMLLYLSYDSAFVISAEFVPFGRDGKLSSLYIAAGATPSAAALTLAGMLYDLLQEGGASAGLRVSTLFYHSRITALLDVGLDGTLWLLAAPHERQPSSAPARYTRSSATALTIDPSPTIVYQVPVGPRSFYDTAMGGSGLLFAPTPGGLQPMTYQWSKNGTPIPGATKEVLNLDPVVAGDAGLYTVAIRNAYGSASSWPIIFGEPSDHKIAGAATEVGSDIVHPNGNVYDQVLLSGPAAGVMADAHQVTRISFVDLTNDIVQVELSGPGTLSLVLENASAPAPATAYNQPNVQYVRGHPGIVVSGATSATNLSVFSVGRITAVNQALFRDDVTYDGMADVAFIAISCIDGGFGGLRTGNVRYYASKGLTGVYAPGVTFTGPVYVGNIDAFDDATPVLELSSAQEIRITGGDLRQSNGQPVLIGKAVPSLFTSGTTSNGEVLPAQPNRGLFQPHHTPTWLGL